MLFIWPIYLDFRLYNIGKEVKIIKCRKNNNGGLADAFLMKYWARYVKLKDCFLRFCFRAFPIFHESWAFPCCIDDQVFGRSKKLRTRSSLRDHVGSTTVGQ